MVHCQVFVNFYYFKYLFRSKTRKRTAKLEPTEQSEQDLTLTQSSDEPVVYDPMDSIKTPGHTHEMHDDDCSCNIGYEEIEMDQFVAAEELVEEVELTTTENSTVLAAACNCNHPITQGKLASRVLSGHRFESGLLDNFT